MNRQTALSEIAMFGGTVDWDCSEITARDKSILIDAPDGYVWSSNGSPVISIHWYGGAASEFWDEVIDQVQDGVDPV